MTRSTCIVTLPRSGSEVLLHYLKSAKNLENGHEMLCLNTPDYPVASRCNNTGVFLKDWTITPINSKESRESFVKQEFAKRIEIVEDWRIHNRPLVLKSFINTFMYGYTSFDQLCEHFDIVILGRKNKLLSILSYFICSRTGIWHEGDPVKIIEAKNTLQNTKFSIDEGAFFRQVQVQNFLTTIQTRIHSFQHSAVSLYYEDYCDSPVQELNKIFKCNVSTLNFPVQKLIENHESHILNIDRLRHIYNKYIIE